jgi:predicted metal-dependent phosphoesterase TrpH
MAGTIRFDPHVHTSASYDARGSVRAVLDAAVEAGLDAVAITDHDTTVAAREAVSLAETLDLTVVPGVEISTREGHLLALGVRDRPPIGDPIDDTVAWVRDHGGVAAIPHPFQRSRHGVRKRDVPDADAIEVFNAWTMTGIQNRRARRYADRYDYPTLGGSDAHAPVMVGHSHTEVDLGAGEPVGNAPAVEAILAAVADGRTRAVGQRAPPHRLLGKYSKSVGRQVLRRVPIAGP